MPSSHTTIHVDSRADVATVADKIIHSAAHKISLVVDHDARIAFHVLNFRLLAREAESADKELVIVSSSIRVQALATKAGLHVQELRGGGMMPADVRESGQQEERTASIVRLGTRWVSDIIPRRSQDGGLTPVTRTSVVRKEENLRDTKSSSHPKRGLPEKQALVFQKIPEQGPEKEFPHPQEAVAGKGVQGMRDILREETQAQDSTWRQFFHSGKKEESEGGRNFSEDIREREGSGDGLHAARRIRLRPRNFFPPFGLIGRRSIHFSFVWGSFVVVVLLIGVFVAATVLPTVTIALTPHTKKVALQIPLQVDTTASVVDAVHHTIPGQVIQENVDNSQTFSTTSTENVQTFAAGQIRVFNQLSSAPQTLVKNTRFVSQDGLLFRTTQNVIVPGAQVSGGQISPSSILVDVVAAESGDKYNINSSTFSIPGFQGTPKFTGFYGKSEAPMKGGFNGTAKVVSDADVSQAKDTLNKLANNQAQDKLKAHVPAGFVLTDDAIEQEPPSVTLTAKSGDRADNFTGTIRNSVRAVIFRQDDIKAIIDSYINNEYKGDPSMDALPQPAIHYSVQTKDFNKGKFAINLQVDQVFAAHIDTVTISTMAIGMSETNVRSYLSSYPGIDQASVTFWPFWVHGVPDNQEHISVKIQYPSQ